MSIVLYPHQMNAINRLRNGSILVGGVGSGKSRTSLGYFFKENGGGFSPVTENVANEEKIVGYGVKGRMNNTPKNLIIITTAKKRDSMEWEQELALYLMSTSKEANAYSNSIVIDSWNNISKYSKVRNAFFIFDEQRVGGTGKWAKTFIKIARQNRWILLSATPGDTWSDYAPVFIANGFYKHFTEFRQRHVVYSQFAKYPKIDHYVEIGLLEKHRRQILVYMNFKRPTIKKHEYVKVSYDKELYSDALKRKWNVYKDKPCKEIAELCSVIRKIVNSDPSRLIELSKVIKKHKKVILFYNFDYELEAIVKYLTSHNIIFSQWNGHKHEEIPETDVWVYLVQYSAGSEGWNCIKTDCIVFYSQTYSYKALTQAAGRIDRMNTPYRELYYYHFMSGSKIDIAIDKCLTNKKNFNEKSFGEKLIN